MPIRATERDRYPPDWKKISHAARERAGNRCEQCKAPNGAMIRRAYYEGRPIYFLQEMTVYETGLCAVTGEEVDGAFWDDCDARRPVRVVLTVAHLDHRPENCAPENLRALCQRCHLAYDADLHRANAAATRRARKAARDLFEGEGTR